MTITPDLMVEEVRHWPAMQVAERVDRLTLDLHHAIDPEMEDAFVWISSGCGREIN